MAMLVRERIAALVGAAIEATMADGGLPESGLPEVVIERPANPDYADYATNVALKLARAARLAPLRLADILVAHMPPADFIESVTVAAPGFINFRLAPAWLTAQLPEIVVAGGAYANNQSGAGKKAQVEFVSANPTGFIHIGGARGAALGDALGNILAAAGYEVAREYYINDAGSRIQPFYNSVYAAYMKALGHDATPDRYDMTYLAPRLVSEFSDSYATLPLVDATAQLGRAALTMVIDDARADLARMGVHFDRWYSEQSLFDSGAVAQTFAQLKEGGHIAVKDGATWFVSTAHGQEKDNVLYRSNGTPTYFISDIAYHYDKLVTRGFDQAVNIWGADHQGHIPRMKAALAALGLDPDALTIITIQLVTVNGERISKTKGNAVPLRDILDEVSADAVRFNLLSRATDSQIDFDLDLARKESNENPVYYVQYAHARIASIQRKAAEAGLDPAAPVDFTLLGSPAELALIRTVLRLPEIVADAARMLEVQRLPHYAIELARLFHSYYTDPANIVVDAAQAELSRARLLLVGAVGVALARTLHLMGMSAPDHMARAEAEA